MVVVFQMAHEMFTQLTHTEKGQLKYGDTSLRNSKFIKDGHIFVELETKVFNLSEIDIMLENCEESAFAEEDRSIEMAQAKSFITSKKLNETNINEKHPAISFIDSKLDCDVLVNNYNMSIKRKLGEDVKAKMELFDKKVGELSSNSREKYLYLQNKRRLKCDATKKQLQQQILESEEAARQIKHQSIKEHESRNKILFTRIEEAEKRQKQKLKLGKERLQTAESILSQVGHRFTLFSRKLNEPQMQPLQNKSLLLSLRNEFDQILISTMTIVESCRKKGVMEPHEISKVSSNSEMLIELINQQSNTLQQLYLEEEEKAKKLQIELKIKQQEEEKQKQALLAEKEKQLADRDPENSYPKLPKELLLSVSRSAYHMYNELKQLLEKYEEIKKKFVSDKVNIKLIMAINKGISVPLSSITSRSGSDIKNKLNDLENVLKGNSIKINNQLAVLNEDAIAYTYLCMAQKFVKQAEGQVSANHSAAFCLALVLVGIWSKHELLGKLFLAQLQLKCPFVVPWYVPQVTGQTDIDYNKKRGYIYSDDGIVEKQDKYLSRISGLVRMYAAVIQSPLPPGQHVHPHGVIEGWKWVSRMLNLDPWPDVTATVLFDFLEVSGHAMMLSYGKQFEKLLYALCHDYYPKIKEVSDSCGGPLKRLQMFLKDCITTKSVPKPEGYLSDSFWSTYHHTGVVGS